MPSSVRPRPGTLRRLCLVALAVTALVTCTEEPTAPGRPGVGTVRVTPQFDAFARLVPLTLDNVRVIVVRPPSDVILTATSTFRPSSQQLILSLPVLLQSTRETLQVTLELYAGSTLLFSGTSSVQVTAGATTAPTSVPVSYQGPGAQTDSITLAPRDTTVPLGAGFPFRATAVDAQLVNVPQFYVSWTATNGNIDGAGVFTAPGVRDTLFVHAVTPNGVQDSTRVFVTAAPSTLTRVGGDGQSGIVGTRLAQPLAVQVNGSDGLPVPGATVTFTVTSGGGSVDSAVATSDAQGIARSGATLGLTVGAQSFTATVAGIATPAIFTATATGVAPIATLIAAGNAHTCEVRTGGPAFCWGDNQFGQLGDGSTAFFRQVATPVATGQTFTSITTGDAHTCALTAAGQAFCWGQNSSGELGDGTTTNRNTPALVSGGRSFGQLVAGAAYTCGLTSAGQAFCWGINLRGELGDGTTSARSVPTPVAGGQLFTRLAIGQGAHSCALDTAGQAFCWGLNGSGQLGDGTTTNRLVPTAVTGSLTFGDIAIGSSSTCAISSVGAGYCWGFNFGQSLTSPTLVGGGQVFTALDMGANHVCALTAAGQAFCGGDNSSGQLGDGSGFDQPTPVAVQGGFTFTAITGGGVHTCGQTSGGTRCWGSNGNGELGDGTTAPRPAPTLVRGPAGSVAINAGNGQSAPVSTNVTIAPSVLVRDAQNNPLPGVEVVFAVTGGGGSLAGTLVLTDAAGIAATGGWTLGATPGTNTVTATVFGSGVAGNPVSFTATGTSASVLTWNGSASNAWTTAVNWTPALVPTSAEDVVIPSGPTNQPTLTTTGNTRSLTIQSGATLTLNGSFTFNIFGDFDNSGLITLTAGAPTIDLRGTTRTMRGNSPAITSVSGGYTLIGSVTVTNVLSVSGGAGILTVGGQFLSASTMSVGSGGSLVMTNAADVVVVSTTLTMGGSDHSGKLTAGQLQVQGSFLQSGTPNSFVATGAHTTSMTGFGSITFQNPGTTASRFQHLFVNGSTVTLQSRVVAGGNATVTVGLTLNGRTLEVLGDFAVQGAGSRLTMTNALDSLLVGGNAFFTGGSTNSLLTDGVLAIGGDFLQVASNSPTSFAPSGNHTTVFNGAALQTVDITSPDTGAAGSHFHNLNLSAATGGVSLGVNAIADGVISTNAAAKLFGNGRSLTMRRAAISGLTVDNAPLILDEQGVFATENLSNVTFQNFPTTGTTMLTIIGPGGTVSARPAVTTTNMTFQPLPTGAGNLYLKLTSTNGGFFTLTMTGSNQSPQVGGNGPALSDPANQQTIGGATILWP